jgi:hypothetical protein
VPTMKIVRKRHHSDYSYNDRSWDPNYYCHVSDVSDSDLLTC